MLAKLAMNKNAFALINTFAHITNKTAHFPMHGAHQHKHAHRRKTKSNFTTTTNFAVGFGAVATPPNALHMQYIRCPFPKRRIGIVAMAARQKQHSSLNCTKS